ncbi:MAG: ABC transporter substrate-binding protein [Pseudolabrys sp.]|jgi:putative ABC transport system substrate-binding protein
MRRREFITLLAGSAASMPLAARAQQPAAMPVVGFLDGGSPRERTQQVAAFRKGLAEGGYQEGQNVAFEFRWAEGQYSRFAELAADLVRRRVSVIAIPGSGVGALAAKTATATIPIVFGSGGNPVTEGLVASLNQPGGNLTGVNFFTAELVAKRMQLLRKVVPSASRIAVLVNPTDAEGYQSLLEVRAAAGGQQVLAFEVASARDIDTAFDSMVSEKADALFVAPGSFFNTRRVQLAVLAARHALPAIYAVRAYPEVGGLMSYGTDVLDGFRQVGVYTARILEGARPTDLPVLQLTKFELVINLNTARALGLTIPADVISLADEVID